MAAKRPARIPASTYRLQLAGSFGFADAEGVLDYLSRLGVTEVYSSPILAARPGSTHGYDIIDHRRLNPELGSAGEFEAFAAALGRKSMGLLLDFVPNHMGVDPASNPYWRDVLENGRSTPSAKFFDIDWDPFAPKLKDKVLLPILGDQYGVELEAGRLQIRYDGGAFSLHYFEHELPLNPKPLWKLLAHNLDLLALDLAPDDPSLVEFQSILFQLEHLPPYTASGPGVAEVRHRESRVALRRLSAVSATRERIREHIEENIQVFNGKPGVPSSFRLLHELLEDQVYRLAYWRTASHEINYRRFFDVNSLGGLRMEDEAVFAATHALVIELIRRGIVTGLRLDHVDGLFDPATYFRRLLHESRGGSPPIHVLAEKILSEGEPLRPDWEIHGTTGYDFLNDLNGLFVDGRHARKFRRLYAGFTGCLDPFPDIVYDSKKVIIETSMSGELNVLAHELDRISEQDWRTRDFTFESLQDALKEVVSCFPVYRTYVDDQGFTDFDERAIEIAIGRALRRNPAMERTIFDMIRGALLPVRRPGQPAEQFEQLARFSRRFQQYTGPLQAKGVEDTAFYRYVPLLSLNEVGGEPDRFGRAPEEFHEANLLRLRHWPLAMLATSTHDTKRGEDARARLNVLSEIPDEFRAELSAWARLNAACKTRIDDRAAPDRNDEYMFYQSLLATWPPEDGGAPSAEYVERLRQYMGKAIKEAKVHSSWIHPSGTYDEAAMSFVDAVLRGPRAGRFLARFLPFQQRVARLGMVNSLAQVVLKTFAPGVPDFYQGTELWDLSLVDPDNRRPVDFERRRAMLEAMEPLLAGGERPADVPAALAGMLANRPDGRIKLFLTAAGLRFRRANSELLVSGDYTPLDATGPRAGHVVAFAREHDGACAVVVVPRLAASLSPDGAPPAGAETWGDTVLRMPARLRARALRDLFTGRSFAPDPAEGRAVRDILGVLPVAVLVC